MFKHRLSAGPKRDPGSVFQIYQRATNGNGRNTCVLRPADWCALRDLNSRPFRCKRTALPAELSARVIDFNYTKFIANTKHFVYMCKRFESLLSLNSLPDYLTPATS